MKNLKKYLALAIAIVMIFSLALPVSAATTAKYDEEANELFQLDLYRGVSTEEFDPDLDSTLNRQTAAVMLLRMFGEEEIAMEMTMAAATEILKDKFTDYADIAEWSAKQVAYCVQNGYISGYPNGTFMPLNNVTGREYCTLNLKMLKYDFQFEEAGNTFGEVAGLDEEETMDFGVDGQITKNVLVGVSHRALTTPFSGTETLLIDKLITDAILTYEDVEAASPMIADIIKDTYVTPEPTETPEPTPTEEPTPTVVYTVKTVVATNGSLVVEFDKELTEEPKAGHFKVTETIMVGEATTSTKEVAVSAVAVEGMKATLTVPAVVAVPQDQSVTYSVVYNNMDAVAADAVVVDGTTPISIINTMDESALDGSEGVNPAATFSVKFNKNLDLTTVAATDFTLKTGTTNVPFTITSAAREVVVKPSSALATNTEYTLTVGTTMNYDVEPVKAVEETTATFTTGNQLTLAKTEFIDASSSDDEIENGTYNRTDFLAADDLRFTFNADLDASTISTSTVKLFNVTDNTYVAVDNNSLFSASNADRITLSPASSLSTEKKYKAMITGVRDLAGNEIDQDIEVTLQIGAAPTTSNAAPATGTSNVNGKLVDVDDVDPIELEFRFGRDIDEATLNNDNVKVWKLDELSNKVTDVPCTITYNAARRTVALTPETDLEDNSDYGIFVGTGLTSSLGVPPDEELEVTLFETGDFTAPTVLSVTPANLTDLNPESSEITINFSEKMDDSLAVSGAIADQSAANGEYIYLEDLTDDDFKNLSGALSWNTAYDELTIDLSNTTADIEYSHSYKIVITGDDNIDYTNPIIDDNEDNIADSNSTNTENAIPMAETYEINFTTKEAGGPEVVAVMIEEDDNNDGFESTDPVITEGDVDVSAVRDIFVKFNKMIDNNEDADGTADGTTNDALYKDSGSGDVGQDASDDADAIVFSTSTSTTPNGNIALEAYDFANSQWSGVSLATATITNVDDASGEYAYITIPNTIVSANTRYRIRVLDSVTDATAKVEDKNDNELDDDYTFNYFVTGTGPSVVTAEPATALKVNSQVNETGGYAKGVTTVVADAANGSDNSWIAIEQVDGTSHITKLKDATSNTSWIFEDGTTAGVEDNSRICNVPTVWRYATNVEVDEHIIVAITGNDRDTTANNNDETGRGEVDLDTITTDTVSLQDANGTVVPFTILNKKLVDFTENNDKTDAVVVIKPTENLASATNYKIVVSGIKDELGNPLSDTNLPFETETVAQEVVISNLNITEDQQNVSVKTAISFNVANHVSTTSESSLNTDYTPNLNEAGVAAGEFAIVQVDGATGAGDLVAADITYDDDADLVTITPEIPLTANTVYRLVVGTQVFGTGDRELDETYDVDFRTGDAKAPAIVSVDYISAGADGLGGDIFIIEVDSEIEALGTNAPAADGSNFNNYFTVEKGSIGNWVDADTSSTYNTGDTGIQSVALSTDRKTLTVTYGNIAAGDYAAEGSTTFAPTALLKAGESTTTAGYQCQTNNATTPAVAFGTDAVTVQ